MEKHGFIQDEKIIKTYKNIEVPILHQKYCKGNNEIPYFWVGHEYLEQLFITAKYKVRDEARAQDVLCELMEDLIKYAWRERAEKLPLINNSIIQSLRTKTKSKAINMFKKDARVAHSLTETEESKWKNEIKDDTDFLEQLSFKDFFETFKKRLAAEKHAATDLPFLEQWIEIGASKRILLAKKMNLTPKEVAKIIRRLKIKGGKIYRTMIAEEEYALKSK